MKNLKELIRCCVFFFNFPATAGLPANDIFLLLDGPPTALRFFIATRWLGSNTATGLLSKSSHMDDMMDIFFAKSNRACDVAESRHVQFATYHHQHQDNTTNIAMLNKQPRQQGNPWPKAASPGFTPFCSAPD